MSVKQATEQAGVYGAQPDLAPILAALNNLPLGYSEGSFAGERWGVTVDMAADGRRWWLWGEQLGGADRVSFNLYLLASGPALRPCEMPREKITSFVLGYNPESASRR